MDIQLTKNFWLSEFISSDTARKHGVDNDLEAEAMFLNLKALCEKVLQPIRDQFGPIRINSGYRTQKLNKLLASLGYGASAASQHTLGEAADIIPVSADLKRVYHWILNTLPFDQIYMGPKGAVEKSFIHVSYKWPNRKQVI